MLELAARRRSKLPATRDIDASNYQGDKGQPDMGNLSLAALIERANQTFSIDTSGGRNHSLEERHLLI